MSETRLAKIIKTTEIFKPRLAEMVSETIGLERFIHCFLNLVSRTPKLAECTERSLFGSLFTCAQLGLIADGFSNRAHLVPLRNNKKPGRPLEANFWPGYMGLKELAERHPSVKYIHPPVAVYAGDNHDFEEGLEPRLVHHPCEYDKRGELIAVYAIASYADDNKVFRWLWRGEIEEHRNRSPAKNEGPWVTDYRAMAYKTAIIEITKYLPQSREIARAIALAEESTRHVSQTFIDLPPELDEPPQTELTDKELADSMRAGNDNEAAGAEVTD